MTSPALVSDLAIAPRWDVVLWHANDRAIGVQVFCRLWIVHAIEDVLAMVQPEWHFAVEFVLALARVSSDRISHKGTPHAPRKIALEQQSALIWSLIVDLLQSVIT